MSVRRRRIARRTDIAGRVLPILLSRKATKELEERKKRLAKKKAAKKKTRRKKTSKKKSKLAFITFTTSTILIITILFSTFIVAEDWGYNYLEEPTTRITFTGNLTNLYEMNDTNIPSPNDNEVLTFNSATQKWISQTASIVARWIVDTSNGFLSTNLTTLSFNDTLLNNTIELKSLNQTEADDLYVNIDGDNMTGTLNMNNGNITNISKTAYDSSGCTDEDFGTFCYDSTYDTMRFVTASNQILQMNQETTMPTKNEEGANVVDGSVVYITSSHGTNPDFKLARADNLSTSGLMGVVTKDCNNNQVCPVVFFGIVHGLDTSNFTTDDHLYLSATEKGNFTITPPEFPDNPVWVATAIRIHPTEGTIFVFPRLDSANGITMNNLGIVGNIIQTDYNIMSLPGNDAIGQNVFAIEMNGTTGIDIPHLVLQPGGAGQASAWVRSGMVVPESVLCLNSTNRTEPQCFADEAGFTWDILNFNTSIAEGADWGITGELEVIKDAKIHGNLNVGNNITGLDTLEFDDGSRIQIGTDSGFNGMDNTFVLLSNQTIGAGGLTHCLLDNQGQKVISCWTSGLNGSGQWTRNSGLYFPDFGITNGTQLTDINFMWQQLGIQPRLSYFSAINETSLAVQFGVETQQVQIHNDLGNGILNVEGDANFIINNSDMDVIGTLHVRERSRIEQVGVGADEPIIIINEKFEDGDLGQFERTTLSGSANEWINVPSIGNCPLDNSDFCARAGAGNSLREMVSNQTTNNIQNLTLSFDLNTEDMNIGNTNFDVILNNNEGSGDVIVYSLSGSNVLDTTIINSTIISIFNNKTIVTIKYQFTGSHPARGTVFVDNIKLNGTTSDSTFENQTIVDSIFKVGDGSQQFIWNDTFKRMEFPGNTTFNNVEEQDLNVTNSFTLNQTTITDFNQINSNSSEFLITNEGIIDNLVDILGSFITNNLNWLNATQIEGLFNSSSWQRSGTNVFLANSGDDVGIGTNLPEVELHITDGDPSQSVDTTAQLAITSDGDAGINILSGEEDFGVIWFGDTDSDNVGQINYEHNSSDTMSFYTNDEQRMTIDGNGTINIINSLNVANNGTFGDTVITKNLIVNNSALFVDSSNDNVLIGNTSLGAKLGIQIDTASKVGQIIKGASSQSTDYLQIMDNSNNLLVNIDEEGSYMSRPTVSAVFDSIREGSLLLTLTTHSDTASQTPNFVGKRSRGTEASQTAVQENDRLFSLGARGHDGNNIGTANRAQILFNADGDWNTTSNPTKVIFRTTEPGTTSTTNKITIKGDGKTGFGTGTPGVLVEMEDTSSNQSILRLQDSDGLCDFNPEAGGIDVSCSSDEDLKENITDVNKSSILDKIMNFRIRDYIVKASNKQMVGVIAQEINITSPEMVTTIIDKNCTNIEIGVDEFNETIYDEVCSEKEMVLVQQPNPWELVSVIQELKNQNDNLKSILDNLFVDGAINVTGVGDDAFTCYQYNPYGCSHGGNATCNIWFSPEGKIDQELCD